jgi:hypothetical protein
VGELPLYNVEGAEAKESLSFVTSFCDILVVVDMKQRRSEEEWESCYVYKKKKRIFPLKRVEISSKKKERRVPKEVR